MYPVRTATILIVSSVLILFGAATNAQERGRSPEDRNSTPSHDVRLCLVPFFSGGLVVGEAAEFIERFDDDFSEKLVYGFGLSLGYNPRPTFGFTLNLERGYKTIPLDDANKGRGWFYSVGFKVNLISQGGTVPYIHIGTGLVTGKYPDYFSTTDLKLGTHLFHRVGLGISVPLSRKMHVRVEFLYRYVFSEGHELEQLYWAEIPFNASAFGVELGLEIPLLSK